eukprot:4257710-Pyramimonas_sp.AAC.1
MDELERGGGQEPIAEEKKLIRELHEKWAHPSKADFCRALRLGRMRPHLVRWAKEEFQCGACKFRVRPKPRRMGSIPKSYRMNHAVGVGLIFIKEGNKVQVPYLNIADWGTHYSMFQRVPKGKKTPYNVWLAFCWSWLRAFGPPEILA